MWEYFLLWLALAVDSSLPDPSRPSLPSPLPSLTPVTSHPHLSDLVWSDVRCLLLLMHSGLHYIIAVHTACTPTLLW